MTLAISDQKTKNVQTRYSDKRLETITDDNKARHSSSTENGTSTWVIYKPNDGAANANSPENPSINFDL